MIEFEPHYSGSTGNFYLVRDGGQTLAIECGVGYPKIQVATKFRVSGLSGCLITHSHLDHIKSAKHLLDNGIDCYASAETWAQYNERIGSPHHRQRTVYDRQDFKVGDFSVRPFEVPHDCPGTLAFQVTGPSDEKLVYITDCQYSPFTFKDVNIFAVECNHDTDLVLQNARSGVIHRGRMTRTVSTHMSLSTLVAMLKANNMESVEAIYLLHLSADNSDEAAFIKAVAEATGRPVYAAGSRP